MADFYKETGQPYLEEYGIDFFIQKNNSAGVTARAHIHPAIEFIYITQGTFQIGIDNEQFMAGVGDLVLFRANAIHTIRLISDDAGEYFVLKINPSMLPVEVAALSMEGMDNIELTEFLNDTLMNKLEGIPGVARISATGMVQQELHVVLDQKLIDAANQKVADAINKKLDDAAEELQEQKEELESSKEKLEDGQSQLTAGADALVEGQNKLQQEKEKLLAAQKELETGLATLKVTYEAMNALQTTVTELESAQATAYQKVADLQALKTMGQEIEAFKAGLTEEQTSYLTDTAAIQKVCDLLKAGATVTDKAAEADAE